MLISSFLLADAGFDVWLGNSRGNIYSSNHVNYSVKSELFWEFSWDQMAKFDLDAMFDVVLTETNERRIYYVGFSQGTLIMFAKLSQDPKFASKVRKFFALGPVVTAAHLMRLFFGNKFFTLNSKLAKVIGMLICENSFFKLLCNDILFQIAGPRSNQFNKSRLLVYIEGEGGTSVMNMIHWVQMVQSGKMQAYNYGSVKQNQLHYGRDSPPIYNISSFNVPIYLYWGKNDWLATVADIQNSLLSVLPKSSIKGKKEFKNYNHFDFMWGLRAAVEIYQPIIMIIKKDRGKKDLLSDLESTTTFQINFS
ncbi:alpha/beta hydrolase fold family protein [Acanthocheilonema viteae]